MSYFNLDVAFFFEKVHSCLFPNAFRRDQRIHDPPHVSGVDDLYEPAAFLILATKTMTSSFVYRTYLERQNIVWSLTQVLL